MIKNIRHGHQDTKLSPKYKGKYGTPSGNNIGVFQGSAISVLLFIIYMGDMVEDNAPINRRSNLPTRIVQDRPEQQSKQLLWETIAAEDRHKMPPREQQIIRTIKKYAVTEGNRRRNMTTAQKQDKKEKKWGEKEQKQEHKWVRDLEEEYKTEQDIKHSSRQPNEKKPIQQENRR